MSQPPSEVPDDVRLGAAHFNLGDYFEAHEAWEDHWGKGGKEERELTLGLIKAAVALHHLEAGNLAGFVWQGTEAVPRLREHRDLWPRLHTGELADAIESLLAQARFQQAVPPDWERPLLPLD